MKIAMVTDSFYPWVGGSETAIRMHVKTMRSMGHDVRVYGLFDQVESPGEDVPTIKVSSRWMGLPLKIYGRYRNLRRELLSFKPDVINAHFMLQSGWAGVACGKSLSIPTVVSVRGKGVFYRPKSWLEVLAFPIFRHRSLTADAMLATSEEMADMVLWRWGFKPTPLANGVETHLFHPDVDCSSVRRELGLDGKRVIFCARRLVVKNGIQYLVKALPRIAKAVPDVQLVLAAPKEREYENLIADAKQLGVFDRMHFVGQVDHDVLPQYFAMADVVVQPSLAEARSLSCLEAMASGSAIVATATGGLAELLTHRLDGYLVPPFEPSTYHVSAPKEEGVQNLAAAVIEVLSDDVLRASLEKNARESSLQYDWSQTSTRTLEIYQQAMKIHEQGGRRYSWWSYFGFDR